MSARSASAPAGVRAKRFARFSSPGHAVTGDRYRSGAERRERIGYEFAHSILDDHSRLAYTELHPDERAETVTAFVERSLAFFESYAIAPKRLQTDNAWCYTHNRALAELLSGRGIHHRTIPPRMPKRNGKVERYQQTLKTRMGPRPALPLIAAQSNGPVASHQPGEK